MYLNEVYATLKQGYKEEGKKFTKIDFTNKFLGKSKSYLYVMKHRQQDISNDSLCRLYVGLKFGFDGVPANSNLANRILLIIENKIASEMEVA
jgi:hypothetical protein